jgi:hypothetical protein
MCFSVTDPAGKPESPFFTEEMTPKLKWNSALKPKWQKYTPIQATCNSQRQTLFEDLMKQQ